VPARISLRVDGFGVSEGFLCNPARLARNGVAGGCARHHTRQRIGARAVELWDEIAHSGRGRLARQGLSGA
jgi:hypothetical protein